MSTFSNTQTLQGIEAIPRGRIGRFIVEREIGQGSVGTVYLFRDPLIGRKVAIKILKPSLPSDKSKVFEKHFIQEARAAGRLNHPNIVTVYDADKSDDLLFIAMEYLDGRELRDLLNKGHQFTFKQIADLIARIANALDYAHQNGVIHRDIKPANIFIVGKYTPKVLDFGIASATRQVADPEASFGMTTMNDRRLLGTPSYMSPEQTRAEIVDGRSDIFSLGVVLYQLLCGELPFKGDSIQDLLDSIAYDNPVPPHDIRTDVPSRLAYIAGKAMAKKLADRYATAGEMANDLNRYLAKERAMQIIEQLRKPGEELADAENSDWLPKAAPVATQQKKFSWPLFAGMGGLVAITIFVIIAWASHRVAPQKNLPTQELALAGKMEPASTVGAPAAPLPKLVADSSETAGERSTSAAEERTLKSNSAKASHEGARAAAKASPKHKQKSAAKAPAAAPAVGAVMVAVAPWGEIFIDGTSRGVAPPLTHLTLPVGMHSVEIRNGENHYAVSIHVTAENETKIGHSF